MAQHDKTHEARIAALEAALGIGNPRPSAGDVSLKEHIESRLTAVEKATEVAARAMEKRLESMNEIRETMRDQATRFVTRDEMDSALKVILADVEINKAFRNQMQGKASAGAVYISYAISLIGIIIGAAALFSG